MKLLRNSSMSAFLSPVVSPGDTLVLHTDGLIECRDEDIDAGLARLTTALAHSALGPDRLADPLLTRLEVAGAPRTTSLSASSVSDAAQPVQGVAA
ncbi:hypothetical protein GCM10027072_47540 [Streptomyces bullii]